MVVTDANLTESEPVESTYSGDVTPSDNLQKYLLSQSIKFKPIKLGGLRRSDDRNHPVGRRFICLL